MTLQGRPIEIAVFAAIFGFPDRGIAVAIVYYFMI